LKAIAAICVGASAGALLRWLLTLRMNAWVPLLPMGTLTANLVGGYVVGVAVAFFAGMPQLSPEWRLLVITGFCGGLTTFSTFSAESVELMQQGELARMGVLVALHLFGSLAMTLLGMATWQWLGAR
jgi:crcB protein